MLKNLLGLRYVYVIAVAFTLINSIVFLLVGVRYSIEGYMTIFRHLSVEEVANPRLPLLESLDWFLVSLVFLVFSLGIVKIFIGYDGSPEALPPWLRIHDFKELKVLLWESILVTLVVWCMSTVARNFRALTWEVMVLPTVVLVLAVGLYLVRGKDAWRGCHFTRRAVTQLTPWPTRRSRTSARQDAFYLFRRPGQLVRSLLSMNVIMPLVAAGLAAAFGLSPARQITLVALGVHDLSIAYLIWRRRQPAAVGSAARA